MIAIGAAVLCLAPAMAIGFTKELDADDDEEESLRHTLWYTVWGPAILLGVLEVAASGYLAPKIGYDMIQVASLCTRPFPHTSHSTPRAFSPGASTHEASHASSRPFRSTATVATCARR